MRAHSTLKPPSRKAADRPKKPYPAFPLSPHPSGKWQKKIRGVIRYFGNWGRTVNGVLTRVEGDGWKDALEKYKLVADDLHAGRTPRMSGDGLTVKELCNRFLMSKRDQWEAGELSARMFAPVPGKPDEATGEYPATAQRVARVFGKKRPVSDLDADDFARLRNGLAKQFGPVRLSNEIQKVRTLFKYGYDAGLIEQPVRFGKFKKPSTTVLRRHRASQGERMLEATEIHKLLGAASIPLKAMLLLGINCAFGNHDCATLPLTAIDLDAGWVDYARPKTGIARRCPLWPETVKAIRVAIAKRPKPKDKQAAGLVFVTTRGRPWLSHDIANPISVACRDLMKRVGIHSKGIGFYTLRHVFRTIADATKDQTAIDLVMGHNDPTIGANYRQRIDDSRLVAVASHVHKWLFG